jgi:hypothetical protein
LGAKKRGPLSREELVSFAQRFGSWADASKATGVPASTIRDRAMSLGVKIADYRERSAASVESSAPAEWGDIRALLKSRGLNPDEWIIQRARVNEWGVDGEMSAQLRVDLEPVTSIIVPARSEGWKPPKPKAREQSGRPDLVAFLGDQHVPFHCVELHELVLEWLREEKPQRVVLLGDLLDFDAISRWSPEPEHTAGVQETIDAAYRVLADYRSAAPDARFEMLAGNHEDRLRNSIIKNLGALYGLRRADEPLEPSVLSTEYLLRLDELGIEYVGSDVGSYDHARVRVSDELQGIHGFVARKGSGASALSTLDHLRVSTVQGHTHRASAVYRTQWTIDNEPRTLVAAEAGTLAEIRDGLGHAARPDWQQGFATASVWGDGLFSLDLAIYVDGALLWRGRRY